MSISTVTSEALQLKLRQLLPSQQGFGTDLSASDTIIPVIDLTAAAEGSQTPEILQTALSFGSQTNFSATNQTTVVANTAGFYRIFGVATARAKSGATVQCSFSMSDGLSNKTIWNQHIVASNTTFGMSVPFDFVVFLASGDSISAISNATDGVMKGSSRQIADVNGDFVNPSGFNPQ